MLDPKLLRSDLNAVADSLAIKRYELDTAAFTALEAQRKELQLAAEALQQERNTYSKTMGKLIGEAKAKGEDIEPLKAKGEQLKNDSAAGRCCTGGCARRAGCAVCKVFPIFPTPLCLRAMMKMIMWKCAAGARLRAFDFEVKDHVDLGDALNGLDFDTASKITGSRFSQMRGGLASLHRALTQFMLNTHIRDHGYEEVYVPYIVNRESLLRHRPAA